METFDMLFEYSKHKKYWQKTQHIKLVLIIPTMSAEELKNYFALIRSGEYFAVFYISFKGIQTSKDGQNWL